MKNFGKLLREAQKIQAEMARLQEEMQNARFEGTAGGGAVRAVVSGAQEPLELKIEPEVLEDADPEMLEDLIITAFREALTKAREHMEEEMKKITGGGMPGLF